MKKLNAFLSKQAILTIYGLLFTTWVNAQANFSGKVVDSSTGEGLPGVAIQIKNTTTGTITNYMGEFSLQLEEFPAPIVFSFVGYLPKEVTIDSPLDNYVLKLDVNVQELEEVVVTGYGSQLERNVTVSIVTVDGDDLQDVATSSIDQALQGKAAGVQVTQSSGAPGGAPSIRIRGATSLLAGVSPLYVIDGVPISNSPSTTNSTGGIGQRYEQSGVSSNPLTTINPADIESIQVLKDASATAIYGSRGANGVILINTKRGKSGKTNINFNGYYGIQTITKKLDLLSADEFTALNREIAATDGTTLAPIFDNPPVSGAGTDWQDEIFRENFDASIKNYNLSISGGEEKTSYFLSAGYFNQQGLIRNSSLDRYNMRLNLDRKVTDWFKISNSFTGSRTREEIVRNDIKNGSEGVVGTALKMAPIIPVRDEEGEYLFHFDFIPNSPTIDNPVALALEPELDKEVTRVLNSIVLDAQPIKGLTIKEAFNIDYLVSNNNNFYPSTTFLGASSNGIVAVGNAESFNWSNELTANYSSVIGTDHLLDLTVGWMVQENKSSARILKGIDYEDESLGYYGVGGINSPDPPIYRVEEWAINSYLSRINYTFMGKYLLTATMRADGSSRFGDNNKYGYFPAVAVGWRFVDENFMAGQELVSDGKLRFSYGITGNQEIDNYAYASPMAGDFTAMGLNQGFVFFSRPTTIANNDLSWESTRQINVGLDLALFRGRVTLVAEYFQKNTYDLLYNTPIPETSGFTTVLANVDSDIENKGFDMNLTGYIIDEGDFQWTTSFNMTFLKSKVNKLSQDTIINNLAIQNIAINDFSRIIVGQPAPVFYGYKTDGIWQTGEEGVPGTVRYQDLNGNGLRGPTDGDIDDRTILGSPLPDYYGGLDTRLSYKGFSVSAFFNFQFGNEIFNANRVQLENLNGTINQLSTVLDRWTPENPSNTMPRATALNAPGRTLDDRFIEDGSFVRFRTLKFNYNFGEQVNKKLGVENLNLYFTVNNLFTWTKYSGYDPEANSFDTSESNLGAGVDFGSYPFSKTYLLGFNIQF